MYFDNFRRNSGIPLLLKLFALIAALYLTFLLLKLFAVVLAIVFTIVKFLLPIAIIGVILYLLLKFLFGYDLLAKYRYPHFRK